MYYIYILYSSKSKNFYYGYTEDFYYNEYYLSSKDLDTFLQGVPIFEDYDSRKDKKYLKEYVNRFQTEKGINLSRHRVVLIAKKA